VIGRRSAGATVRAKCPSSQAFNKHGPARRVGREQYDRASCGEDIDPFGPLADHLPERVPETRRGKVLQGHLNRARTRKATVAAATALACARHGRRTIALSLDIAHGLADSLDPGRGLHH
jgi:hypothetical protein